MEKELLDAKRKEREKKEEHRLKMIELKHNLDLQIHQRDQGIKAFNGLSAVETVMNKVRETYYPIYSPILFPPSLPLSLSTLH